MRQEFDKGTWLDPEEMAYPSGSMAAGRKAKAMCPDGKARVCRVSIPDTFFSIPATTRYDGRHRRGFVMIENNVLTFTEQQQ